MLSQCETAENEQRARAEDLCTLLLEAEQDEDPLLDAMLADCLQLLTKAA